MSISEAEFEVYCREHMAGYKVPRKLLIVDSLPRVHGWKLLRKDLRQKFGGSGS